MPNFKCGQVLGAMANQRQTPQDDNNSIPESPFEQIKRVDHNGNEFWSARVLPTADSIKKLERAQKKRLESGKKNDE